MTILDKEVGEMGVSKEVYQACVDILHEELRPAMGCTEPIAVAYAGALARKTLGMMPDKVELVVSGNIIKNVKSVIVPNTGGAILKTKNGDIEVNNTIEARLLRFKKLLRSEVANVLFE